MQDGDREHGDRARDDGRTSPEFDMESLLRLEGNSPAVVGDVDGEHDSNRKRPRSPSPGGSRDIDQFFDEDNKMLEDEFSRLASGLLREICRTEFEASRTYLSDIIACDSAEEANRLGRIVVASGRFYRGGFLCISVHEDHIHIVHDCAYSNNSCRCKFAKGAEIKDNIRPALRKRVPIGRLQERDWYNILKYFTTDGRRCKLLVLRGAVRGLPAGIESLESSRYRRNTLERMVETCTGQGGAELQQGLQIRYERGKGVRGRFEAHKVPRKSRMLLTAEKIQEKLRMYPTCPIAAIIDTDHWLNDNELCLLRADDKQVKDNIDVWMKKLCRWTFEDFNAFYKRKDCYPIFMAGYIPFEDKYYTVTESIEIMEQLLYYQFDGDDDEVRNFLYHLYIVLERKTPKLNTLLIQSPPSAGKNFFIDAYLCYLLNRGQFMRANRTNNFAFQQAYGKRVIVWDEPNYEASMTDTLKMICGGGDYNVNVKNRDAQQVFRTPIIILTNNHIPLMSDVAFKDRVVQFKWKAAPFLKEYHKLPNPLAAFELLVKWDIVKDNVIIE